MANELIHGSVGVALTQAEWEAVGAHVFNCQATGDMVYASSSTQLSRVGIGTAGQHLTVTCVSCDLLPTWSTVTVLAAASQTEQETASSTTVAVTPGVQQFHPSAAKAWVTDNTSSCSANASYGVSGVSSGAAGIQTVTWSAAFPGGCTYAVAGTSFDPAGVPHNAITCPAACTVIVHQRNNSNALADSVYGIVAYGPLA